MLADTNKPNKKFVRSAKLLREMFPHFTSHVTILALGSAQRQSSTTERKRDDSNSNETIKIICDIRQTTLVLCVLFLDSKLDISISEQFRFIIFDGMNFFF